jgi:hypothetical protein
MKKTPNKSMCILALAFILIFGITNARALVVGTGSFDVLLIGTFISPDEKGNSRTFDLWTDKDKWRFKVTKSRNMGQADVSGSRLLMEIFPRKINLFGDERILAPLKQPELEGKNFKLRGRLYINAKRFHLNIVEEVVEEKSPDDEKKE